MIYFIQAGSTGPIKIGYTENEESLKKRIEALRTSSPFSLKLIATKGGNLSDEKLLHEKFHMLHLAGEWFQANQILINYIKNMNDEIYNKPQENLNSFFSPIALEVLEARHIQSAILIEDGNISEAAKNLGISRNTLYRKMQKYNIKKSPKN